MRSVHSHDGAAGPRPPRYSVGDKEGRMRAFTTVRAPPSLSQTKQMGVWGLWPRRAKHASAWRGSRGKAPAFLGVSNSKRIGIRRGPSTRHRLT
jgi:hypothetical protein